jgi:hypothetical protein
MPPSTFSITWPSWVDDVDPGRSADASATPVLASYHCGANGPAPGSRPGSGLGLGSGPGTGVGTPLLGGSLSSPRQPGLQGAAPPSATPSTAAATTTVTTSARTPRRPGQRTRLLGLGDLRRTTVSSSWCEGPSGHLSPFSTGQGSSGTHGVSAHRLAVLPGGAAAMVTARPRKRWAERGSQAATLTALPSRR